MDDTTSPVVASPELNFSATPEPVVVAPEPQVVKIHGKLDRNGVAIGTGRRKTSVARVRLKAGNGATSINGRKLEEYFPNIRDLQMIEAPLLATEKLGHVDLWVRVNGGGTTGQAGAIVMGIARALEAMNPTLHSLLSENGFLTRDSRMVERKKYGFKKARRSPQFSETIIRIRVSDLFQRLICLVHFEQKCAFKCFAVESDLWFSLALRQHDKWVVLRTFLKRERRRYS